jgi:hypothetical protein
MDGKVSVVYNASVAEWSNAMDCKPIITVGSNPTRCSNLGSVAESGLLQQS